MVCSNMFTNVYPYIVRDRDLSRSSCSVNCGAFLPIERVEIAHHLVEAGGVQVRVDLSGLDASVAEQLLQHSQVGTARVHVGGKGMAQHVR
jgi:hypothetical protein